MADGLPEVNLWLRDDDGRPRTSIRIVSSVYESAVPALIEVGAREADAWGEERVQLIEGRTYDYELAAPRPGLRLREGVVHRSRLSSASVERGTIEPEGFTGFLPLILEDLHGNRIAQGAVEVRSSKLEYRKHYRDMLDEVASRATDLLLELRAPSLTRLTPKPASDARTIAQQFSFLRHLISSREFREAVARVLAAPHTGTTQDTRERDIRRGVRPGGGLLRQIAASHPRLLLPSDHPLARRMPSVPRKLLAPVAKDTVDTPENRFVKFAVSSFVAFLAQMERRLVGSKKPENVRLRREIAADRAELGNLLSHDLFRSVSDAQLLPLGSSVLQRRGGYREILRPWLRFSLAAMLQWRGGDDVYSGGKRDVATLYEYWLFFRLLDLVSKKLNIPAASLKNLIEKTADGFGLKLRSGRHVPIDGEFVNGSRRLRVRFSFNRTFTRTSPAGSEGGESNYPAAGSWTRRMRPDFTLTLWPAAFSEAEAEEQELIVHVHFDAKYRVESLVELFGDDSGDEPQVEKRTIALAGTAKRDDLLKMHAYRDAIRRTAGAYVLYPGTENKKWRSFHELLPGLGAFSVVPGSNHGLEGVSRFIDDVINQLVNRASQLEQQNYEVRKIHRQSPIMMPGLPLPDRAADGNRRTPPTGQYVFLGCCPNAEAMATSLLISRHAFPLPGGGLSAAVAAARYVLLYVAGAMVRPVLRRVSRDGLRVMKGDALLAAGVAGVAAGELYGVFDLEEPEDELRLWEWDVPALTRVVTEENPAAPQTRILSELAAAAATGA